MRIVEIRGAVNHPVPPSSRSASIRAEVIIPRSTSIGPVRLAELVRAWLRAERARDLVVLRAHQISGPALNWLLSLPVQEGLRVWLISPQPLPQVPAVAVGPEVTGS